MKIKKLWFSFFAISFIILQSFSLKCQTTNDYFTVKNRWTVKASVARYKTAFYKNVFAHVGDKFFQTTNRKMVNFKVEANYGISKFVEVGLLAGFQHYEYVDESIFETDGDFFEYKNKRSFAPLFGVNANFHILPFFVKSNTCRWDLYLTTKYAGCYLPHLEWDVSDSPYSKYRQEYGLGLGIGYYFKNIVGIFVEGSVGQYFYFNKMLQIHYDLFTGLVKIPDNQESNFSIRIGVAAKISK